jgi:hypothetical protein
VLSPKSRRAAVIFTVALVSFAAGTIAQGRYPEINQAESALQAALGHMQGARDVSAATRSTLSGWSIRRSANWKPARRSRLRTAIEPEAEGAA